MLLAAPLIGSQDVKPSKAKESLYNRWRSKHWGCSPSIVSPCFAPTGPRFGARDGRTGSFPLPGLSVWRDLPAFAKQAGLDVSEAKVIHERPAVIQELEWPIWLVSSFSSPQKDPVRTILFSFYNGKLFRILSVTIGMKPKG